MMWDEPPGGVFPSAGHMSGKHVLNIAPISFSSATLPIGHVEYVDETHYEKLRREHRHTHVFRFDSRSGHVANISLAPGVSPLGDVEGAARADTNLLLLGKVIQSSLVSWLVKNNRRVLRFSKPIVFLGSKARTRLLTAALQELGIRPKADLEVRTRFVMDTRLITPPGSEEHPQLGLLIDIRTSNVIDVPIAELATRGLNLLGRYVCKRKEATSDLAPRLETVGAISKISGDRVYLTDAVGADVVNAAEVLLEPRQENLEEVIRLYYGARSQQIISQLRRSRASVVNADRKLTQIRELLGSLRDKHETVFAEGVVASFGDFIEQSSPLFPASISTEPPTLLFGAQGRNFGTSPDEGLRSWGPYKYMHHARNEPLLAVICEANNRGRTEQFVQMLTAGFPEEDWQAREGGSKWPKANPFQGGLIGKFRLSRVQAEYEEAVSPSAAHYEQAITCLLNRLHQTPDIALVQTREATRKLYGSESPYLAAKAGFMTAGIPVQAITAEKLEPAIRDNPYILGDVALAVYAKLDGVPWRISTRGVTSHELVVGLGYTETGETRLGERARYVGITTVFRGDGRYLVWGQTREVEFKDYADALLETLQVTVRQVRDENAWSVGEEVRLIFHVFKPLKNEEIKAIKSLVASIAADDFRVCYAFLDLSQNHDYEIFDVVQQGKQYRSGAGAMQTRGKAVPSRGLALKLDARTALLQLVGPQELKTDLQGTPAPLLIRLHPDSDFDDLTYLVRQVYHFTYMSWRSSRAASEPVTILYSRLIARALANLKPLSDWNSRSLTQGGLRNRHWFL